MGFKIPYKSIQNLFISFVKIIMLLINWTITLVIALLALPIWLPIIIWKSGLIISDHLLKYITSD